MTSLVFNDNDLTEVDQNFVELPDKEVLTILWRRLLAYPLVTTFFNERQDINDSCFEFII